MMVPVEGRLLRDLCCFFPELGAHNRFRTMKINAFDVNDQDAAGQFSANHKALHQVGIDRDRSAAVHTEGFTDAGNEKQERDTRIAHDVAETVDAIVAWSVGNRECFLIENSHKTWAIAFRRAIQTFGPRCGDRYKRSSFDQPSVAIIEVIDFLDDRGWQLLAVERL